MGVRTEEGLLCQDVQSYINRTMAWLTRDPHSKDFSTESKCASLVESRLLLKEGVLECFFFFPRESWVEGGTGYVF